MYELLQGHTLQLYPNADIRLAMSRAIAVRDRARLAHQQGEVALAMSALASVRRPGENNYDSQYIGRADTPSEMLTTGRRDFGGIRFIS
jgi:hypothetical protein